MNNDNTVGNRTLGIPGNPIPPQWQDPSIGPHWPADLPFTGNQFDDVTASTLADAKISCRRKNSDLIFKYYGAADNAYRSATAGHTFTMPPVPMAAGVIGPLGGQDGSVAEYSWMDGILGPVCDPLQTPADNTVSRTESGPFAGMGNPPGTAIIGPENPTNPGVYPALPGDTCKPGTRKTLAKPDGSVITLVRWQGPWGGHWDLVA